MRCPVNLGPGPYDNNPTDASTFGVNIDLATGETYAKAWGESVGWVNFDTRTTQGPTDQQARLNFCQNRFTWGEHVGWINLNDALHFVGLGPDC